MKKFTYCLPVFAAIILASCGGGGGGSPAPPAPVTDVILSGRISFDRVPFKATLGQGLDFGSVIDAPARGVTVEAIDSSTSAVLATTTSGVNGDYSMTVPGNRDLFVRAKAQMLANGTGASWNFRVVNNTTGQLYALDGTPFNSGLTAVTRNLRAVSGFGTSLYTSTRPAGPFAILDTAYRVKELLLSAQPSLALPSLDLYWSVSNRPASPFCPSSGNIVSTAYQRSVSDNCPVSNVAPRGIYIQGDYMNGAGDTDEFDQSVVAHEFGHYVEDMLARTDSIGGAHSANDRLDLRVAFSEGWGNAFSAMVLNDPIYRDSYSGVNSDNDVDIESGQDPNAGWFSESTVQQILWDVFDPANESGDGVALGFTPIYQTIVGPMRTTTAFAGIHAFAAGLKSIRPGEASAIDLLFTAAPRNITGTSDFADNETKNGGLTITLPVYKPLLLNQSPPLPVVCTSAQFGGYNRLANRQFMKLDIPAPMTVSITLTSSGGPPGSSPANDPDFRLWQQGAIVYRGEEVSTGTPRQEVKNNLFLQAGTYVLEIYDYEYIGSSTSFNNSTLRCMTVLVTG
jgi:hypothetical protein